MMYAPIILFTYNRPDFTEKALQALDKNPEATHSKLYIFSDAAKTENMISAVEENRAVLQAFKRNSHFKSIEIIEQIENKGLANSIINGVTDIFTKHEAVIAIEDDCIVSPYFLKFMNDALTYYKDDIAVGSISGWTPNLQYPPNFDKDIFAIQRSCSCTWSTWKRCWQDVDWDMDKFTLMRYDRKLISRCNKAGTDRFVRFIRQKKYNLQSWSVRFGMSLVQKSQNTIYPKYSYVENIGHDHRGTHTSQAKLSVPFQVDSKNAIKNIKLCPSSEIIASKEIEKQFARIYGGNIFRRLMKIFYIYGGEKILDVWRKK